MQNARTAWDWLKEHFRSWKWQHALLSASLVGLVSATAYAVFPALRESSLVVQIVALCGLVGTIVACAGLIMTADSRAAERKRRDDLVKLLDAMHDTARAVTLLLDSAPFSDHGCYRHPRRTAVNRQSDSPAAQRWATAAAFTLAQIDAYTRGSTLAEDIEARIRVPRSTPNVALFECDHGMGRVYDHLAIGGCGLRDAIEMLADSLSVPRPSIQLPAARTSAKPGY